MAVQSLLSLPQAQLYAVVCSLIATVTVQIKFEVTPQGVQQVFMEKAYVHRAFMDNVPHKMTENDFWQRYVKAEVTLLVSL